MQMNFSMHPETGCKMVVACKDQVELIRSNLNWTTTDKSASKNPLHQLMYLSPASFCFCARLPHIVKYTFLFLYRKKHKFFIQFAKVHFKLSWLEQSEVISDWYLGGVWIEVEQGWSQRSTCSRWNETQ